MFDAVFRTFSQARLLTGAIVVAAGLALFTVPPIPSAAFSGNCQASPESACCTCGTSQGEYFCEDGATAGGVVCSNDGYCPVPQPMCIVPE